jgi:two-component system OmpR family response regulator
MRILIVEDNNQLRKSLVDYMRDEGFATDSAADGDEGLYKAMNWDYDLLLLDVMLPGIYGWDVLKNLREAGKMMPAIMLTARDQVEDRVKGLNVGADDYLVKPFDMEELVARVRAALRRTGGSPNPELVMGPIKLNTAAKNITFHEVPIVLTSREYALMEILMMHRDEVVSRDYIYEHLFDERDDTMSNMLDVYIYKLRQKFDKKHIVTRRGLGYQVMA